MISGNIWPSTNLWQCPSCPAPRLPDVDHLLAFMGPGGSANLVIGLGNVHRLPFDDDDDDDDNEDEDEDDEDDDEHPKGYISGIT